ncbi:MAG: glycosyltransferase family 4 protein [Hyphomicrobiales bacterium]|nr:glycosyltransferase family 4 protein [Hyphomicrobiales bacterium]MBV8826317.1 glycosyltransferase family 4 protein [Hyphomicrobiales bacterium]
MPKLLFFHSEDWAFLRHFMPMARAAQAAGFEVAVAVRVRNDAHRLEGAGCRVVPLEAERGSLGPLEILRSVARMVRIVRAERPDVVHCIALRTVVLGGSAARLAGAPCLVLAPTGLGHLWIENGLVERLARPLVRFLIGRVLRRPSTRYVFENSEDPHEFGLDPAGANVTIVGGAGVDPALVPLMPEPPAPPVKIAVIGRMLIPKGIAETVEAVRRARAQGAPVELNLYGAPDPSNRRSFSEDQLRCWAAEPGIVWHGPTDDVARVWRENHIAMLLSYREGLPKALVEAAAAGRPVVATDVTGCREVVRDGIEGFLVPRGDVDAAASALARLAGDAVLRARMGAAAHARFQERFTEEAVIRAMTALYAELRKQTK